MAENIGVAQISISADASGVETGISKAKKSLADLGVTASKSGREAAAGLGQVAGASEKMDAATKRTAAAIERQALALGKTKSEYYSAKAAIEGNTAALEPYIAKLREAEARAGGATKAQSGFIGSLGSLQGALAGLGLGVSIGGMAAFVKTAIEAADETGKLAQKTGLATEEVSGLQLAFRQAGAGEQFQQSLTKLAKNAAEGNAAFAAMGITLKGADGNLKSTRQLIGEVAEKFAGYKDSAEKTALAQELFGKSGADLIPLLNAGADALSDYDQKAKDLGLTLSQETTKNAEEFNDTLDLIGQGVAGVGRQVAADLLPTLSALAKEFLSSAANSGNLTTAANALSTALKALYSAGVGIVTIFKSVGEAIGGQFAALAQAAQGNLIQAVKIYKNTTADFYTTLKSGAQSVGSVWGETAAAAGKAASGSVADVRKVDQAIDSASKNIKTAAPIVGNYEKSLKKAGGGAKAAADDFSKLVKKITENSDGYAEAEAAANGYNKSQLEFLKLAGSDVWAKFTNQQRAQIAALFETKIVQEQAADATKNLIKANQDAAAAREKYMASLGTGLEKLQAEIVAQKESNERLGLSKEAIAELDAAKLELLATEKERQAVREFDKNLDEQEYNALIKTAQGYRELAKLKQEGASKQAGLDFEKASAEAASKAADDWEKTAKSIEDALSDALMRGFESGKGFGKSLAGSIENTFKTMVANTVSKKATQALTSVLGGNKEDAMGYMQALVTATTRNSEGGKDYGKAIGQAIGTYFGGPVGAAIGGAIGKALKLVDYSGTYHTGGSAVYGRNTQTMTGASAEAYFGSGFQLSRNGKIDDKASQQSLDIAKIISTALDTFAEGFGKKAGYIVGTGFADDTSPDGAWGALRIMQGNQSIIDWSSGKDKWPGREFANGEEGQKQYLNALASDVRKVMIDAAPGWADAILNGLGDAITMEGLAAAAEQIAATQKAFESIGRIMPQLAGLGDDAITNLVNLFGGIDNLGSAFNSYYENFYSEAERSANSTKQLTEELQKLGVEGLPGTRDAFRKLVDEAFASGNQELGASLIKLSGSFAQLTQETGKLGTAAKASAEQIAAEAANLNTRLLQAQGDTAALRQQELDALDESNRALLEHIFALEDKKQADAEAAALAEQIASETASLNQRLMQAQGDTIGLRKLEVESVNAANRALIEQIQAQERYNEIHAESEGLVTRLLQTQGDTAALRERELSVLHDSNQVLLKHIFMLEDQAKATELLGRLTGDFAQYGLSELEKKIEDIDKVAEDSINSLEEWGQASYDNILVVERWADASRKAAIAADALAKAQSSFDDLGKAVDLEKSALEAAFNEVQAALQAEINKFASELSAVKGLFSRSISAERESLTSAANEQKSALQKQIDALNGVSDASEKAAGNLKSVIDALQGAIKNLRGLDVLERSNYAQAVGQIDSILANAKQGIIPDASALQDPLSVITSNTSDSYSSSFDFNRDQLVQAAKLEELAAIAGKQLGFEDQVLENDKKQLQALQDQIKLVDDQLQADLKSLDEISKWGEAQFNALEGIDASIVTMDEAQKAVAELTAKYQDDQIKKIEEQMKQAEDEHKKSINSLNMIYQAGLMQINALQGINATLGSANYHLGILSDAVKKAEAAQKDAEKSAKDVPKFASGGFHIGGFRIVGEDGPEIEATGPARYWDASKTKEMLKGDTSPQEVRYLREDNRAQASALVAINARLTKLMERWDRDGMPAVRAEDA